MCILNNHLCQIRILSEADSTFLQAMAKYMTKNSELFETFDNSFMSRTHIRKNSTESIRYSSLIPRITIDTISNNSILRQEIVFKRVFIIL